MIGVCVPGYKMNHLHDLRVDHLSGSFGRPEAGPAGPTIALIILPAAASFDLVRHRQVQNASSERARTSGAIRGTVRVGKD